MRGNTERLAAILRPITEAIHPPESMRRIRRINAALDEEGRATEYALASSIADSGAVSLAVQNNDALIADEASTLDFSSAFDVTESPTGEANISPVFGTGAGEFAEGNHTHAGGGTTITVQEGDVTASATVDTLDFDASDFTVSISPAGEANIGLAYGTSAGTPAEGNHSHTSALAVYEGATLKSGSVSAIVFDASDFNVVDTGGSEEVTLQYGTGANQPAEGNHTHTVALDDLSDVAITSARNGSVLAYDGSSWADRAVYAFAVGPFYINDLPGTATTQATLGYFNTATALSRNGNEIKMARSGYIVGALVTSDAARTAGTATVRVRISGADTALDAGSCALDATNTTSDSTIVASTLGVSFSSGQTIGANVTTSGWTPTTADLAVWLLIQINPFD